MMNTVSNRANAIFFYALSCLLTFSALSAVTMFNHYPEVTAKINKVNVKEFGEYMYPRRPRPLTKAELELDFEFDLTNEFNWNVKQIFVWVMAEYHDKNIPINQVSVWDQLVTSKQAASFRKVKVSTEYALTESANIKGKNVTLSINWDIHPRVGWLKKRGGSSQNSFLLTLPSSHQWWRHKTMIFLFCTRII